MTILCVINLSQPIGPSLAYCGLIRFGLFLIRPAILGGVFFPALLFSSLFLFLLLASLANQTYSAIWRFTRWVFGAEGDYWRDEFTPIISVLTICFQESQSGESALHSGVVATPENLFKCREK